MSLLCLWSFSRFWMAGFASTSDRTTSYSHWQTGIGVCQKVFIFQLHHAKSELLPRTERTIMKMHKIRIIMISEETTARFCGDEVRREVAAVAGQVRSLLRRWIKQFDSFNITKFWFMMVVVSIQLFSFRFVIVDSNQKAQYMGQAFHGRLSFCNQSGQPNIFFLLL